MEKKNIRILSLVLAVLLVIALLPGSAWAETVAGEQKAVESDEITDASSIPQSEPEAEGKTVPTNGPSPVDAAMPPEPENVPSDSTEPTVVASGYCGDSSNEGGEESVMWTLNSVGTLTISGTGAMADYSDSKTVPWYSKRTTNTSVAVTGGVTSVGCYAFSDCISLASIYICEGVKSIGDCAFSDCTSLASITIPEGMKSIGDSAFSNCTSLASIFIPKGVMSVGSSAFSGCYNLEMITVDTLNTVYHSAGNCLIKTASKELVSGCKNSIIPSDGSITSIGDWAFGGCSSLASISIPESVESIGNWAFSGCSSLASISISENVESIGAQTFLGCTILASISIPKSVKSIGWGAFEGCASLASISIPKSVNSIGIHAFIGCYNLEMITVDTLNKVYHSAGNCLIKTASKELICGCKNSIIPSDGSITSIGDWAFDGCSSLASISIPEDVNSIGGAAFYNCTRLTKITIPASVETIEAYAFDGCTGLTDVYYGGSKTQWAPLSSNASIPAGATVHYNYDPSVASGYCGDPNVNGGENVAWTLDSEGVLTISGTGMMADFWSNNIPWNELKNSIKTVVIEPGVTSVGRYAFFQCSSLTDVTMPEGITSINEVAFLGCSGLTDVTIPSSVTSIKYDSFAACTGLKEITLSANVTDVGAQAFSGCTALADIYYGGSLMKWKSFGLIAPDSTTIHCAYIASGNCGAPSNEGGEASVTWYLDNDGTLTISGIGKMASYSSNGTQPWASFTDSILSCVIEDGVSSIGSYAFCSCSSLAIITIPKGFSQLGNDAFSGCSSLKTISFPASLSYLDYHAFDNSSFTDVYYDGSLLTWKSFYGWISLSGSTTIHCAYIGSGNCGDPANEGGEESVTWVLDNDGKLTISGTGNMADYTSGETPWKDYRKSIVSYEIVSGVTGIGAYTFYDCSNLTSAPIPDSVASIGDYAFGECTGLTKMIIPASVTTIGNAAFNDCTNVKDTSYLGTLAQWRAISMGSNNAAIQKNLTIGDTLYLNYSKNTLGFAYAITSDYCLIVFNDVSMSDSTSANSEWSWSGYRDSIKEIIIESGASYIGDYGFYKCKNVEKVTIPASVTEIGDHAFDGCNAINDTAYQGTLNQWVNIPIGESNKAMTGKLVIGENRYLNAGTCGDNLIWTLTDKGELNISGTGAMKDYAAGACPWHEDYELISGVVIGNGVTHIGRYAFDDCFNITAVSIPDDVSKIGYYAFEDCTELTDVYYGGNGAQWLSVNILSGNDPLRNATMHYTYETVTSATLTDTGRSLSLDDLTYVNQFCTIDTELSVDYIRANGGLLVWGTEISAENATYANATAANNGYRVEGLKKYQGEYYQQSKGVAPSDFGTTFYLRLYLQLEDGSYVYTPLKTYSINTYCENMKKNADQKTLKLINAMLAYGEAAREYFA